MATNPWTATASGNPMGMGRPQWLPGPGMGPTDMPSYGSSPTAPGMVSASGLTPSQIPPAQPGMASGGLYGGAPTGVQGDWGNGAGIGAGPTGAVTTVNSGYSWPGSTPSSTPPAQPGMAGNPTVDQLYAGVGKPGGLAGGLVDQEGYDYWTNRANSGEDITGAFNSSAQTVYNNMLNGQPSPYTSQNQIGYSNMLGGGQAGVTGGGATGGGSQQHQGFYSSPGSTMAQSGGGGMAALADLKAYSQSPYLAQMGAGLKDQFTGFMNDGLAANRGNAVAAGGVGGSRQGIAEARTMTDAGKGFDSALANLYGQDYQSQMNRNLQQYQGDQQFNLGQAGLGLRAGEMANQYDLGRRGLDLGYQNSNNSYNLGQQGLGLQSRGQDMSFYTAQRGQDQSGAALGASLYAQGQQGMWNPINQTTGAMSPWNGYGTTTNTGSSGGGLTGAVGGLLGGAQLAKNFGWF